MRNLYEWIEEFLILQSDISLEKTVVLVNAMN